MAGRVGMAANRSPSQAMAIRERIQGVEIAARLEKHALGKIKMGPTQVSAATALLRKVVPDLQAATLDLTGTLRVVKKYYGVPDAGTGS